jgi:hypothetical protein
MALQTQKLVMTALGIRDHLQPREGQPRVPDGIHLRWAFERELGFPWLGFYLFRRVHEPPDLVCLGANISEFGAFYGGSRTATLQTSAGQIGVQSDQVLVQAQPDAHRGRPGIELSGRQHLLLALPEDRPAHEVKLDLYFRGEADLEVTGLLWGRPVVRQQVSGMAGEAHEVSLVSDALTAVEIRVQGPDAPAIVEDLGFALVYQSATRGWEGVPGFRYPLSLPVGHPDYPCPGAPGSLGEAMDVALQRIVYGDPGRWEEPFIQMHDQLQRLVEGGPGWPMADRQVEAEAMPERPGPGGGQPVRTQVSPLDLLLLASLQPAVAQMLGLYWLDREVWPDGRYDYLLVADNAGVFQGDPHVALDMLGGMDPLGLVEAPAEELCAYVVFGRGLEPQAEPLFPPHHVRVYALPGSGVQMTAEQAGPGNAGLRWEAAEVGPEQLLAAAARYHVWRADLGDGGPPGAGAFPDEAYQLLTEEEPVLVTRPDQPPDRRAEHPRDWPPFSLHYLDSGLAQGWYSYRVSGTDLFGRHSPLSEPAAWYQWTPPPDPRPSYYQDPAGHRRVDESGARWAVYLQHRSPPPPPTAIEAFALDPADPYVVKDGAYRAHWGARAQQVGLRVRWQWTAMHQQQAPGVEGFHVHYQPGQRNARLGHISTVSAGGADCTVQTDLPGTEAADAFRGAVLHVGADAFTVKGSQSVSTNQGRCLALTVNATAGKEPPAGAPCTLLIPQDYALGTVHVRKGDVRVVGKGTKWSANLAGKEFRVAGDPQQYRVKEVTSESLLSLERPFAGHTGSDERYAIRPHPQYTDFSAADAWQKRLAVVAFEDNVVETISPWRAADGYALQGRQAIVDGLAVDLTLDTPNLSGIPYQDVRIWLGDASSTGGRTYRLQGVEVETDPPKVRVKLDPAEGAPGVQGQPTPWVIGLPLPLRQYEVFVAAPSDLAPTLDDPIVYAHVGVNAVDERGVAGPVGAPVKVFRVWRERPEAPKPLKDAETLEASPADYHGQSFHTVSWRARQPYQAHVFRALDETLFQVDWQARLQGDRPALDPSQAEHRKLFPDEAVDGRWTLVRCRQVAAELNWLNTLPREARAREQALAHYRGLSNDALRILGGLAGPKGSPGNERAFSQITVEPLGASTGSYRDTLDGRSTNRYFYRVAYVDAVHNRGQMGLSSPPICLPDVVPPLKPTVSEVQGGDCQITLRWNANPDPDVATYHIYRTEDRARTRDLRLMKRVAVVTAPATFTTVDRPERDQLDCFYRVVPVAPDGQKGTPQAPRSVSLEAHPDDVRGARYRVRWAPQRNAHYVRYEIYRGHEGLDLDHIAGMTCVHTESLSPLAWTDKVPGLTTFYYRIVTVDEAGNASVPSEVVAARAYDHGPPTEPAWERAAWVRLDAAGKEQAWSASGAGLEPGVALVLTTPQARVSLLVQRKEGDRWQSVTPWLREPEYDANMEVWRFCAYDRSADPGQAQVYRLKLISPAGKIVELKTEHELARP